MKKKLIYILAGCMMASVSCEQEPIVPEDAPAPPAACNSCPTGATAGTASFAKFVSIGNGFVAGFQAGALFNTGQSNSLAKLLNGQFACAGGSATFNQPDINSVNGYNIQSSIPGVINLGRLILFDPDGTTGTRSAAPYPAAYPGAAAVTCPSAVSATPAVPAPYNTADVPTAFAGNKATINNYGVPLIYLGQILTAATGNPGAGSTYNGLWARFAQEPGVKSILQESLAAGGSFYLFWAGMEDALLYAATGADGTYPLTASGTFDAYYDNMIGGFLTNMPVGVKGVVGNIPSLSSFPYFTAVPWNTIVIDVATAASLTTNLATPYNAFLDGMVTNAIITPAEKTKRMLAYVAGKDASGVAIKDPAGNQYKNGVLLTDETLTDLSPYMTGPYAGLAPYARARQATANDLIPLAAGSILGTCFGGNASAVYGVSFPVGDKYAVITPEIVEIETAIGLYNVTISDAVAASGNRLALADVKTAYANLLGASIATKGTIVNGVTIASSFAPPAGVFSEDGLHLNNRGNAFTANIFIDAINTKFTATVPKICINQYSGTGLPINP